MKIKDKNANHLSLCGAILRKLRALKKPRAISIDTIVEEVRSITRTASRDSVILALKELYPLVGLSAGMVYPSIELFHSIDSGYFEARKMVSSREKRAVAIYIHEQKLSALDAVFMDAGSACEAIALEMAYGSKGHFTVMTNNMRAVRAFMANPSIRVRITGGIYVLDDEALVGDGAIFSESDYSVRFAIVGASRLTATHVYNHGITGEERIKVKYWEIPANELIVPATLQKFAGKDASCFGELYREPLEPRNTTEVNPSIDQIAVSRLQRLREEGLEDHGVSGTHAPRFRADRCTIVIEPEWMIKETYKGRDCEREQLLNIVNNINANQSRSCVSVEFAQVSPDRLE